MDRERLPANVSALKTAVSSPTPSGERRRDKRHGSDQIILTFLGVDHTALNWSLGGFLVADRHPDMVVGAKVAGMLTVRGYNRRFQFSAEMLRRDARTKELAFRFLKPSWALITALERITDTKS